MKLFSPRPRRRLPLLHGHESGQSIVETALIMPVFFLLVFGFITFCLVLFSMGNANFASRAALRYATTHSSTSYFPATQQGFKNVITPYIFQYPANTWSVSTFYYRNGSSSVDNGVGNGIYLTLTISYTFNVLGRAYTPISYSTTGCGIVLQ